MADEPPNNSFQADESEPRRKRSRLSSSDDIESVAKELADIKSESLVVTEAGTSVNSATRDGKYYFADGSCVILVENTLFNVHRTIMSRDASSFSSLFTLPQGELNSEGKSDRDPIVLSGDTVSEFRNFLWAMYAMPHELKALFEMQSDFPKLLDIAKVANKYSFKSLENWACDALQTSVSRRPFPFNETSPAHREELTRVIRLACLCQHERLLRTAVGTLQQRLATSPACLALALSLCEELESDAIPGSVRPSVRVLVGIAHFAALARGPAFWDAPETRLAQRTKLRVLVGHYNLTRKWFDIQAEPAPEFTHAPSCVAWNHHTCKLSWQAFWEESITSASVTKLELTDVGEKLKVILSAIDHWGPWGQASVMHHECKKEVRKVLVRRIKDFQDNLADYFPPN